MQSEFLNKLIEEYKKAQAVLVNEYNKISNRMKQIEQELLQLKGRHDQCVDMLPKDETPVEPPPAA